MRDAAFYELIFSKFLTLLRSSDFGGDYCGRREIHVVNHKGKKV
jgi:hypothetical protein